DVRRIEKVIERHGERFLARIFTATERARAERRANRFETYAKRFAAKEACAKALGTGLRAGVFWRDMGVINLPSGRPTMKLTGGALKRLQMITPAGCEARVDVTITDEGPMALGVVGVSARAPGAGRAGCQKHSRAIDVACDLDDRCMPVTSSRAGLERSFGIGSNTLILQQKLDYQMVMQILWGFIAPSRPNG